MKTKIIFLVALMLFAGSAFAFDYNYAKDVTVSTDFNVTIDANQSIIIIQTDKNTFTYNAQISRSVTLPISKVFTVRPGDCPDMNQLLDPIKNYLGTTGLNRLDSVLTKMEDLNASNQKYLDSVNDRVRSVSDNIRASAQQITEHIDQNLLPKVDEFYLIKRELQDCNSSLLMHENDYRLMEVQRDANATLYAQVSSGNDDVQMGLAIVIVVLVLLLFVLAGERFGILPSFDTWRKRS